MLSSSLSVYWIGALAQVLFSLRMLTQWLASERAGKVVVTASFWYISLISSLLMAVYGFLRQDPIIVTGQAITSLIYFRNLTLMDHWRTLPLAFKTMAFAVLPSVMLLNPMGSLDPFLATLSAASLKRPVFLLGIGAQLLFILRFIYQWYYAERAESSILPIGFWVMSLIGAICFVSYAVFRHDPIIFIAHVSGLLVYSRQIMLSLKVSVLQKASKA